MASIKDGTFRASARYLGRLVLILGLSWVGVNTMASIRELIRGPKLAHDTSDVEFGDLWLIPKDGAWSFAEAPWIASASTAPLSEVQSQLRSDNADNVATRNDSYSERSLASAMESAGTLRVDEPSLKARVALGTQGEISAATIAVPSPGDRWTLLELTPGCKPQSDGMHLLPLDQEAKQLIGRWSKDHQLLMELVSLDTDRDVLLSRWRSAGWQVRHSGWGSPSSFSFLCVKQGTVVYAWSKQVARINSLLLTSSPDVAVRQVARVQGEG